MVLRVRGSTGSLGKLTLQRYIYIRFSATSFQSSKCLALALDPFGLFSRKCKFTCGLGCRADQFGAKRYD